MVEHSFKGLFILVDLFVWFSEQRLSTGQRSFQSNLPQNAVVWKHQDEWANE